MKKRTSFLSALLALFLVVLALYSPSCGYVVSTPPPGTEPAVTEVVETETVPTREPAAPVRLIGWTSSGPEDELQRYLMDQCGVDYELAETVDYWALLPEMFAAGEELDILQMDTTHFPLYADWGYLAPVDESAGFALDEFIEPLVQAFAYEDTPYAVPTEFDTLALFYNSDLFAEAGLEPPVDWTWDDLREIAWLIKDYSGAYGFAVPADAYLFYPFVLQAGGWIMSPDFRETGIDWGEAIDAGWFYTSAREEGWAIIPEDVGASWHAEAFGWGEVAMVLGGYWMRAYLSEQFPDLAYGAVQVPAGPGGKGTMFSAGAYAVSATSPDPLSAWEAIACLTSEEAQSLLLESGTVLPSRKAFGEHPILLEDPVTSALFNSIWYASPYEWGPRHDEVALLVTEALRRVYYEGWSVEDSFVQAADDIRATIEQ